MKQVFSFFTNVRSHSKKVVLRLRKDTKKHFKGLQKFYSFRQNRSPFLLKASVTFFILLAMMISGIIATQQFKQPQEKEPTIVVRPTLPPSRSGLRSPSPVTDEKNNMILFREHKEEDYPEDNLRKYVSMTNEKEAVIDVIDNKRTNGAMTIRVYQGDVEQFLGYLQYLESTDSSYTEYEDVGLQPDVSQLQLLESFEHTSEIFQEPVSLPITETGLYYITAERGGERADIFFSYADIAVTAKKGPDSYVFWVQNVQTGRSISGGTVSVYEVKDPGYSQVSSAGFTTQGLAEVPFNPRADIAIITGGSNTVAVPLNLVYTHRTYSDPYFHTYSDRKTFLFTDRPLYKPGDMVYFKAIVRDTNDLEYSIPAGRMFVRLSDSSWRDDAVVIYEGYHDINEYGSFDGQIVLPDDLKSDIYQLAIYEENPDTSEKERYELYETGQRIQIEEYRKPEYFLSVDTDTQQVLQGEEYRFTVQGNYFSGQPLAGKDVEYSLYRSDTWYTYDLDDTLEPHSHMFGDSPFDSGEIQLDENGTANLVFSAPHIDDENDTIIGIKVEYMDKTGNPAVSYKNVLVRRGAFLMKRTKTIYGFEEQAKRSIEFQLVPVKERYKDSIQGVTVDLDVFLRSWDTQRNRRSTKKIEETTLATDSEGKFSYEFSGLHAGWYEVQLEVFDEFRNLIKEQYSMYVYESGRARFFNQYQSGEERAEISIEPLGEEAVPGENVDVTVSSQTPDQDILVSFEREYAHRWYVVPLSGTQSTVSLPVLDTDIPNTFLVASAFSQNRFIQDKAELKVSTASKEVSVEFSSLYETYGPGDTVELDITTRDLNGNPVQGEVAVWAMDKALLQLADENLGEIMDTFWYERPHWARTAHSLESIIWRDYPGGMGGGCFTPDTQVFMADGSSLAIQDIGVGDSITTRLSENSEKLVTAEVTDVHSATVPGYLIINKTLQVTPDHYMFVNGMWKEAGSTKPGDTLVQSDGSILIVESVEWVKKDTTVYNLEVAGYHTFFADGIWVHNQKGEVLRSNFADLAYWNPGVHTDASGYARVSFSLPDNLTTWVVQGVVASPGTQVGQGSVDIVVTKDVIVRPVLSNIMRLGDQSRISALVHNFTDDDQTFDVSLDFSAGTITDNVEKKIALDQGEMQEVFWDVSPNGATAEAALTFSAESKESEAFSDSIQQLVPVEEFGFYEESSQTKKGEETFKVSLYDDGSTTGSAIELFLSTSVLGSLPEAMEYLVAYPWGCIEQTTSRFVPVIIAAENPDFFPNVFEGKEKEAMIEQGVARIKKYQNDSGGWSWWSGSQKNYFVTIYVLEYLLRAQELGINLGDEMIPKVTALLTSEEDLDGSEQVLQSYGLSLLNSSEAFPISRFKNLESDILPFAVMSNVRQGITDPGKNGLNVLLSHVHEDESSAYWEEASDGRRFNSRESSTALALRALMMADPENPVVGKAVQYLRENKEHARWNHTFDTALSVQAITEYARYYREEVDSVSYRVTFDDRLLAEDTVEEQDGFYKKISVPTRFFQNRPSDLSIETDKPSLLSSTLVTRDFITDPAYDGRKQGMSIKRSYINVQEKDKPLAPGDLVLVRLSVDLVRNTEGYALIHDQLPAGLIPVNDNLKNQENVGTADDSWSFEQKEYGLASVTIPVHRLSHGQETYEYYARVINSGIFTAPPAYAVMMYEPDVYSYSSAESVTVEHGERSQTILTQEEIEQVMATQVQEQESRIQKKLEKEVKKEVQDIKKQNRALEERVESMRYVVYSLLGLFVVVMIGVGYIFRRKVGKILRRIKKHISHKFHRENNS